LRPQPFLAFAFLAFAFLALSLEARLILLLPVGHLLPASFTFLVAPLLGLLALHLVDLDLPLLDLVLKELLDALDRVQDLQAVRLGFQFGHLPLPFLLQATFLLFLFPAPPLLGFLPFLLPLAFLGLAALSLLFLGAPACLLGLAPALFLLGVLDLAGLAGLREQRAAGGPGRTAGAAATAQRTGEERRARRRWRRFIQGLGELRLAAGCRDVGRLV